MVVVRSLPFLALRLLALFGELDGLLEWRAIDPRLSVESMTRLVIGELSLQPCQGCRLLPRPGLVKVGMLLEEALIKAVICAATTGADRGL